MIQTSSGGPEGKDTVGQVDSFLSPPPRRVPLWAIVVLLLCIAVSVSTYDWHKEKIRGDFTTYSLAASRVLYHGGNPYSKEEVGQNYKYLPLNAVLLGPFTILPIPIAQGIWFALNVGLLLWMLSLHGRLGGENRPWWVWCIALAIGLRFFWGNLQLGQWNTSVYCLAFAGLVFSARRPWAGGMLLALATTLKYMPGFFIVYLLIRRRWTAALAMLVGLLVWIFGAPSIVLGPTRTMNLLSEYVQKSQESYGNMRATTSNGYSFPDLCVAYLSPVPRESGRKAQSINLANLDIQTARHVADGIAISILLAIFALSAYAIRNSCAFPADLRLVEIGLWFCLLLVISPEVRKAHLLTLFTPAFGLALVLARKERRNLTAWLAGLSLALAFALILASSTISDGSHLPGLLKTYGGYTASVLVLAIGAFGVLLRECRKPQTRIGTSWEEKPCR